jgi:peptidoglycan hydrolase-like protein with peptidoglycan-binding domain
VVTDGETGEEESYELDLGHLDPLDTIGGAQARMKQIGAYYGTVTNTMSLPFVMALKAFQESHGLRPTGELDASTQAALRETHGG